ncbi:MAG: hypothetical protein PHE67_00730 [Campylobacterales bacterium]|nr:hypothetical protein [Campylobacterales bacterium]
MHQTKNSDSVLLTNFKALSPREQQFVISLGLLKTVKGTIQITDVISLLLSKNNNGVIAVNKDISQELFTKLIEKVKG